jgi:hypothetical protein
MANNANNTAAALARSGIHAYQGRWWHPMPGGHWVYWDATASSWVLFNATNSGSQLATNPDMNQYQSGYRGLNDANPSPATSAAAPGAGTTASGRATGWYWRDGRWLWFNGQTFVPAQ